MGRAYALRGGTRVSCLLLTGCVDSGERVIYTGIELLGSWGAVFKVHLLVFEHGINKSSIILASCVTPCSVALRIHLVGVLLGECGAGTSVRNAPGANTGHWTPGIAGN